jgi:hypothetical protein
MWNLEARFRGNHTAAMPVHVFPAQKVTLVTALEARMGLESQERVGLVIKLAAGASKL